MNRLLPALVSLILGMFFFGTTAFACRFCPANDDSAAAIAVHAGVWFMISLTAAVFGGFAAMIFDQYRRHRQIREKAGRS